MTGKNRCFILMVTLFSFVFLLSACQPQMPSSETEDPMSLPSSSVSELNNSLNNSLADQLEIPLPAGLCTPQWRCISSSIKAYQLENCSFEKRQECRSGCLNGTCRAASVCSVGFKCINNHRRGYQQEDCGWITERECEWGCRDAECLPRPANASNISVVEEEPPEEEPQVVVDNSKMLAPGETAVITISEINHNLSIYILDEGKVRLLLDGRKSDWLTEGQSYTVNVTTVTIVEILFQPYSGGTRAIRYTAG